MSDTQTPRLRIIRFADHRREASVEADLARIMATLRQAAHPEYIRALANQIEWRIEHDRGTSHAYQPPGSA